MIVRVLTLLAVSVSIMIALDIVALGVEQLGAPLQGMLLLCAGPSWIRAALIGVFTGRILARMTSR